MYGGLVLLAEIELGEGNSKQAARLFGFVQARLESAADSFQEPDARAFQRVHLAFQKKKGIEEFQRAGAALTLEQVVKMIE